MTFNSYEFALFVAAVVGLYNSVPPKVRPAVLLVSSTVFYGWYAPWNVGLLAYVTAVSYFGARAVSTRSTGWLTATVVTVMLAPLVWFKWLAAFWTPAAFGSLNRGSLLTDIAVPAGLSFYTLQAISYVADVHLGTLPVERRWHRLALYLAWFPTVLSGPIERARSIFGQLRDCATTDWRHAYVGVKYVLWGLFCKSVVADNIATVVDEVLSNVRAASGGSLWIAFSLFYMQVFFDLAGYTAIAIGVARMFNVRLSQNFDRPYLAASFRDFWWRWHITASRWFRDYVYVSLPGNRKRRWVRVGQLLIVFAASGLWHGATWNYAVWGALHGIAYAVEQESRKRLARGAARVRARLSLVLRPVKVLVTFTAVTLAWVPFRLRDLSEAQTAVGRMLLLDRAASFGSVHSALTGHFVAAVIVIVVAAVWLDASMARRDAMETVPDSTRRILRDLVVVNCLVIALALLGDSGSRDFMYARF